MNGEFADLLPVFLAEATGRLEHLYKLLPTLAEHPAHRQEAQRELHTLKGAGRMLKLTAFAQLCHELEELVHRQEENLIPVLQRGLDQLSAALQQLATPSASQATQEAPPPAASDHLRLPAKDLDLVADRATRLRILARGAGVFHSQLRELAQLAERGAYESDLQGVLAVLAAAIRKLALELEAGQVRLQRLAENHLAHALNLQLQPLGPLLHRLARHARELASELRKDVQVTIRGEEVKLDRRIIRELEDALIHVVRNAVDHGLEDSQERVAAGKQACGQLVLEAKVEGAQVHLTVADDGRGIAGTKIAEEAVAKGLITAKEARQMSQEEALRLLFLPGFSTQKKATEISGRGVGLDAVAAACSRVGGEVLLSSTQGGGTQVILRLPVARRGEEVLVVKVGRTKLLYPKAAVSRFRTVVPENIVERGERLFYREGNKLIPLISLARLIGEEEPSGGILLSGEFGGTELTVHGEAVVGEEEVVVREIGGIKLLPDYYAGAAVLANGEALPLLAPQALKFAQKRKPAGKAAAAPARETLRVLLVDDSLVTREMERRLLADAGFSVAVAGDAEEALTLLAEKPVDCLITDIEMPGMSGLDLTRRLRSLPQFAHLPVIVVSTRDRPEDRLEGLAAGADAYLAKQGLDASELIALIRRLGGHG